MPHFHLYGKFYLTTILGSEEITDFAFYVASKAAEYRIGVNLCCNMSEYLLEKLDFGRCGQENCIPYEILDNPLTNECSDIFRGILIGKDDFIGIEKSRIPDIQSFLADIILCETVSHIELVFEDVHSSSDAMMSHREIRVNELCDTFVKTPKSHSELPNVRFVIGKGLV